MIFLHTPGRTNRVVAQLRRLVGCVPTLKNVFKGLREFLPLVELEPMRLDDASTQRGRGLLELTTEIVLALNLSQLCKHLEGFPLRVQRLTFVAAKHFNPI